MGLETVTYIADLVVTNPTAADPISQGDDHERNIKSALQNSLVGFPGAITVTGTDGGAVNAYTITPLGALIAYGNRMVAVFSPTVTNTGACTLAVGALAAKALTSVSGAALVANDLVVGTIYAAYYNGMQFQLLSITKNYADQLSFGASLPAQALGLLTSTGTVASFTKSLGFALNEAKGAAVASAAAPDIWSGNGNTLHITGTTNITGFVAAPQAGARRRLLFDGAVLLTNSATLNIQGGANYTTVAGDIVEVFADTTTSFYLSVTMPAASTAETKTGTAIKAVSPASLLGALGISSSFTSADQTITPAGALTIAHGLGRTPLLMFGFLRFVSGADNYSAGDVTAALFDVANSKGAALTADATNIYVRYGAGSTGANVFAVIDKSGGNPQPLANAAASYFVKAFA